MKDQQRQKEVTMVNFINTFFSYILVVLVFVIVIGIGITIGIFLRKRKDKQAEINDSVTAANESK